MITNDIDVSMKTQVEMITTLILTVLSFAILCLPAGTSILEAVK